MKGNVTGINCKVYMFDIIEVAVETCVWAAEGEKLFFDKPCVNDRQHPG